MPTATRRKTSLTLDGGALDQAKEFGVNVSAVAEAALIKAVAEARREKWRNENAEAFAAQAEWHAENGHPLAEIIAAPAGAAWKD